MDFGDILDQWEKRGPEINKKKNPADIPAKPDSQPKPNPTAAWIRINGIYDKDAENETNTQNPAEYRRRLRSKKPDATLDIHGLTSDEAWESLEHFFDSAKNRGLEKLLIIHGKGNHSKGDAVLGRTVRVFIEQHPLAGESGHEKAAGGGSGATWVLLKSPR